MNRFASLSLLTGLLTFVGCGSSTAPTADVDPSDTTPTTAPATSPATPAVADAAVGSPANVVSQFLDEIRRGGEDTLANELLTQKAQSELKRIGQSVQPIGSPDARFEVTRFEKVPNDPSSALVHSIWSEPTNGPSSQFQVVWAVHLEPVGWRISGLAMELDPNQPPMVIDFENGDLMARLLSQQVEQAANSTQATAVDPTISR
jgi:hypothetical protein